MIHLRPFRLMTGIFMATMAFTAALYAADQPTKTLPLPGEVISISGNTGFIIPAKAQLTGKPAPWVWYAPTIPGLPNVQEKWLIEELLKAGITVAGVDVGESFGSPAGSKIFSAFYARMVARGYSSKPVLLGRSRGGLQALSWAANNPDKVAAFAGIYPVSNIESFPGIAKAADAFQMKPEDLRRDIAEYNPVDRLSPLAHAHIPIFAIHGDADEVVPIEKNSILMRDRYTALGGKMVLVVAHGQGHNDWPGFFENKQLFDFVRENSIR